MEKEKSNIQNLSVLLPDEAGKFKSDRNCQNVSDDRNAESCAGFL